MAPSLHLYPYNVSMFTNVLASALQKLLLVQDKHYED
jgi:hypothetical protein